MRLSSKSNITGLQRPASTCLENTSWEEEDLIQEQNSIVILNVLLVCPRKFLDNKELSNQEKGNGTRVDQKS